MCFLTVRVRPEEAAKIALLCRLVLVAPVYDIA
jgi:hypothetical protein